MVVLRIADYFQFDADRIDQPLLKLKTFSSPISALEHDKHLSIEFVQPYTKDPETFFAQANPSNSYLFLKLEELFKSIQYELDISWAVLGEIYGTVTIEKQPKIKYRRVKSSLERKSNFVKKLPYIPEKIVFDTDPELPRLLIAPLYGNNPTFGVRELLQNAIDSCHEREFEEKKRGNDYEPLIKVELEQENSKFFFKIEDNGKGMTIFELKNYFLKAGSSFRKSLDWQKRYTDTDGKSQVMRSGRFGVGALAAFLLGEEIEVETKSISEKYTCSFKAKLDSEQIEIGKNVTEREGTLIKIEISNKTYEVLLKNPSKNWDDWYMFKKPQIIYKTIRGNGYIKKDLFNLDVINDDNHIIYPEGFDKVIWSYKIPNSKTSCNGIVILNSYSIQRQPDIIKLPILHIIDYGGKLNLNLSRSNINGFLPFGDILIEDICRDIIACLLTKDADKMIIDNKIITKNKIGYTHPSEIKGIFNSLYSHKGFVPNISYFTDNITKPIIKVNLKRSNHNPTDFLFLESNASSIYIIEYDSYQSNSSFINDLSDNNSPYFIADGAEKWIFKKEYYNYIFENNTNRASKFTKENHIVNEIAKGWVEITMKKSKSPKEQTSISIDDLQKVNFLQIGVVLKNKHRGFPILNNLLTKYFGDNKIIPYLLEDRRKLYTKAFDELEPYIKKYLK